MRTTGIITCFNHSGYIGAAIESLVIDSDHWRHYFLLMGILWGTYVNTVRMRERANPAGLRSISM